MADVSTLGQSLSIIDRIRDQQSQFTDLTTQLATGRRTQNFSGLGRDVLSTQRSRADLASIINYERNITNANTRLQLTSGALDGFKTQSNNFFGIAAGLSVESDHQEGQIQFIDDLTTPDIVEQIARGYNSAAPDTDFETLQNFSENTFDFLSDLINTRDGDRFLFGGAETLTPPLNDTGTLDAAISTLIQDWKEGNLTNDELIASLTERTATTTTPGAITDSTIGYNAALSAGNAGTISIRVADNTELEYTTLGNDQAFRDVLVFSAFLKSADLGPIADEVSIDETTGLATVITKGAPGDTTSESRSNFFEVYTNLVGRLDNAIDNIDSSRFDLENTRARIADVEQDYTIERSLLLNTIGDAENVDINEVAVEIQVLQTQIGASFRVTALLQDLSLVNFI